MQNYAGRAVILARNLSQKTTAKYSFRVRGTNERIEAEEVLIEGFRFCPTHLSSEFRTEEALGCGLVAVGTNLNLSMEDVKKDPRLRKLIFSAFTGATDAETKQVVDHGSYLLVTQEGMFYIP